MGAFVPFSPTLPLAPDRPLRIALFTGNYVHVEDGVSRTLGRLVGYLVAEGHDVLVLGPTVEAPAVQQPGRFLAVPSVPIPTRPEYRFTVGFPQRLQRQVEAFAPDIVHLASPDVLGHRALTWAETQNVPIVATYHTHFASYAHYYHASFLESTIWRIGRRFYNRCDEVYVPTRTMEYELAAHGITSTLRLWPRGIELDRFSPDRRSDDWRGVHGFAPNDVVVLFVSRLVKEKGLDVFVDVLKRLASTRAKALIVGEGPERDALEAALPSAVFTGHLDGDALATAYASADVFLFPSETETFGNVTLEAMASGLAVVCADGGGSRSLVDDGQTGVLCPPRNVKAFTAATERLVRDAARRAGLGVAARVAASEYDWPSVLHRMTTYYSGVLAQRLPADA